MEIDLTHILIAVIDSQDGEVRVPLSIFEEEKGEMVLTLDQEDDVLVLRLVEPQEVIDSVSTGTADV